MGVRGVNLGNWLVLERWMGDSPLARAGAEDDHAYVRMVADEERARALGEHYRSYVTERTFTWLAEQGIDLVRIPVPYHLFGSAHHIGCAPYLDQALDWASRAGMGVLIDLHTVPLSQNGFDNGGYTALCAWSRSTRRMLQTVDLLERVADRYAAHPALWGIEPLNEPVSKLVYLANLPTNARYPTRVLRSWPISRKRLCWFYQHVYDRVRPIVGPDTKLVFHDHFSLAGWERFDPGHGDKNVLIDTHQYAAFADGRLAHRDLSSYLALVARMGERVARAARHHGVLVGEWSLANHAPHPSDAWYRAYAAAQLAAWDRGGVGSCFWSLRVQGRARENWSFEHCIRNGWL